MKITILSFTDRGAKLAESVRSWLLGPDSASKFEVSARRCSGGGLGEIVAEVFPGSDALLFIGAAGIAVRAIAPHVRSKLTDPAVLVADERGSYVIPILSGHVGGANDLALLLASGLGMVPVITTATDIHGVLSIDSWAVKHGLRIENAPRIKEVSMKVLSGKRLRVISEFALRNPPEVFDWTLHKDAFSLFSGSGSADFVQVCEESEVGMTAGESDGRVAAEESDGIGAVGESDDKRTVADEPGSPAEPDVYIGTHRIEKLLAEALCLVPKRLFVGIGCRRGTAPDRIAELFDEVFRECALNPAAVSCISSIDLKADEAGLLRFAEERGYELQFFDAEALAGLSESYGFTASGFVKRITGVDSVCERAAIKAAERSMDPQERSMDPQERSMNPPVMGMDSPRMLAGGERPPFVPTPDNERSSASAYAEEGCASGEPGAGDAPRGDAPFLLVKKRSKDGVTIAVACSTNPIDD